MRIAVIGAGEMGTAHAHAYATRPKRDVELAAIFSRHPARARTLAKDVGARPTTDASEILSDDSIDAVDVCVPSGHHRKFVVPALEHGKHVLSETPMALTLADADAMIRAARRNRRLLGVAQTMRFVEPYRRAWADVSSGRLGRPTLVVARRLARPYWAQRPLHSFRTYGEPVLELLIHDIDVANWFLGRPLSVLAWGAIGRSRTAEHVLLIVTYPGGTALLEGSGMMPRGFPFTTSLRVQCGRGVLDLSARFLGGPIPQEEFHVYTEGGLANVRVDGPDPYEAECIAFVRCIEKRTDPMARSAAREREAIRVAVAAQESLRTHCRIRL